jgi:hypothetical protein
MACTEENAASKRERRPLLSSGILAFGSSKNDSSLFFLRERETIMFSTTKRMAKRREKLARRGMRTKKKTMKRIEKTKSKNRKKEKEG